MNQLIARNRMQCRNDAIEKAVASRIANGEMTLEQGIRAYEELSAVPGIGYKHVTSNPFAGSDFWFPLQQDYIPLQNYGGAINKRIDEYIIQARARKNSEDSACPVPNQDSPTRELDIQQDKHARPKRKLSFDDAVEEVRHGGDVVAKNRDEAKQIAEATGDGPPVWDPPHGPGQSPHFHPTRGGERFGGHVLY